MNAEEVTQACERFLTVWHENGRAPFERDCPTLDYDSYYKKRLKVRRDWICLDRASGPGWSGVYMVRKADGQVFQIKGYGVPNLRKPCGQIGDLISELAREGT